MDDFTKKVYGFIRAEGLISEGDHVVVGVSGGSDSVCLLSVLWELKELLKTEISAVHVNHMLRGDEALRDQNFTEELCRELDVPCRIYSEDIAAMAKREQLSVEESGRVFRYRCFEDSLEGEGKIAVAHHLDDHCETVLMNLFRGSGVEGLTGISPRRGNIVRPLMCTGKDEIEDYLERKGLSCCEDSTNLETDYMRNRIRLELLPYIREKINPGADRHIAGMSAVLRDVMKHIGDEAAAAAGQIIDREPPGDKLKAGKAPVLSMDSRAFGEQDAAIQREVIRLALCRACGSVKDIQMSHIEDLRALFSKKSGSSMSLPYGLRAIRDYDSVVIDRVAEGEPSDELMIPVETDTGDKFCVELENFSLSFSVKPAKGNKMAEIPQKLYTKCFDYDKIKGSLFLRRRRAGDYMEISGGRKKSLKRILIDDKIPSSLRDELVLLAEGSHVLWIVDNGRISEYYKITEKTGHVLTADASVYAAKGRENE